MRSENSSSRILESAHGMCASACAVACRTSRDRACLPCPALPCPALLRNNESTTTPPPPQRTAGPTSSTCKICVALASTAGCCAPAGPSRGTRLSSAGARSTWRPPATRALVRAAGGDEGRVRLEAAGRRKRKRRRRAAPTATRDQTWYCHTKRTAPSPCPGSACSHALWGHPAGPLLDGRIRGRHRCCVRKGHWPQGGTAGPRRRPLPLAPGPCHCLSPPPVSPCARVWPEQVPYRDHAAAACGMRHP